MSSPPEKSADRSRRVLIVEDHALVAKFYRMALERAGGFACVVTEDVTEMLAAVEADPRAGGVVPSTKGTL